MKPKNKITIREIASRAKVSPATVSRVLRKDPIVSTRKIDLVNKVIEQYSYRPNPVAKSLASGSFPAVHAIMSDMRNPFYSEMARGIEDIARENGYTVVFGNTDDCLDREIEYLSVAKSHQFAGVILMSALGGPREMEALRELTCPVILLNRMVPGFDGDSVIINNEGGGYKATKYLIDLGHKEICCLVGVRYSSASTDRLNGFLRALKEAGINCSSGAVKYGDLRFESGEEFGKQLIQNGLNCTAVFAGNDLMAAGIISILIQNNYRVPEDVSIIGFDDIIFSKMPGIGLTTVRQPQIEMGRSAAKLLLERIKGESSSIKSIMFEPEIIVRKTCAGPREKKNDLIQQTSGNLRE